jgi:hypothetical protein
MPFWTKTRDRASAHPSNGARTATATAHTIYIQSGASSICRALSSKQVA